MSSGGPAGSAGAAAIRAPSRGLRYGLHEPDSVVDGPSLGKDFKTVLGVEHQAQTAPDDGVVVGQDDRGVSDLHGRRCYPCDRQRLSVIARNGARRIPDVSLACGWDRSAHDPSDRRRGV
ncbi:MAG TPA: hypothetical protein VFY45_24940 [Baekduia sp.]|nr:hypothetical protein [Baekduia sp.]